MIPLVGEHTLICDARGARNTSNFPEYLITIDKVPYLPEYDTLNKYVI